jgi:hypothetical protein
LARLLLIIQGASQGVTSTQLPTSYIPQLRRRDQQWSRLFFGPLHEASGGITKHINPFICSHLLPVLSPLVIDLPEAGADPRV